MQILGALMIEVVFSVTSHFLVFKLTTSKSTVHPPAKMKLGVHHFVSFGALILSGIAASAVSSSPVVDLGYALYKATISAVSFKRTPQKIPALIRIGKPRILYLSKYQICCTSTWVAQIFYPSAAIEQQVGRYPRWILR